MKYIQRNGAIIATTHQPSHLRVVFFVQKQEKNNGINLEHQPHRL